MKCLRRLILFVCLVASILPLTTSCYYEPPEGYTIKHHTYKEIVAFAKTLDPEAKVSEHHTDTNIDEWNRNFREWDATINGIDCHVSSVGTMVGNSGVMAGEFPMQYYVIDTDYDYYLLQKILSEKQPDWKIKRTDVAYRYRLNSMFSVETPYADNKELSAEELEFAWAEAYEIYQEYASCSIKKEVWFSVSIPRVYSNEEDEYIKYGILLMRDFSNEAKTKFFEDYEKAWDLMDSDLPIKE